MDLCVWCFCITREVGVTHGLGLEVGRATRTTKSLGLATSESFALQMGA